jgi:hypothetical protein
MMRARKSAPVPDLPFTGGAVGYIGYDVVRTLERLPEGPPDDAGLPDALFIVTDVVLVLDNLLNRARMVSAVEVAPGASTEARGRAYDEARKKLDAYMKRLGAPSRLAPLAMDAAIRPAESTSPYPGPDYEKGVLELKEHIEAGDIFQAVLSRRMEVKGAVDPLTLYRCLRSLNPAPYLYYLKLDDVAIVGSSPEVLVKVEDREVTVPDRRHAAGEPRGRRRAREGASIPRSWPSTRCSWTWAATTSAASQRTARCAWWSTSRSSATHTSSTSSPRCAAPCAKGSTQWTRSRRASRPARSRARRKSERWSCWTASSGPGADPTRAQSGTSDGARTASIQQLPSARA